MKKILIAIGAGLFAIIIIIAVSISFFLTRQDARVNAEKLVRAVTMYAKDIKTQGKAMPQTVTLNELISQKLLTEQDVKGFSGMDVVINLSSDANRPQETLIQVRMPNGTEFRVMADNSVQLTQ